MIYHYIKTALRHLRRDPLYSGLNMIGLAVGMAAAILLALWGWDEWRYDRFHDQAPDLYRIVIKWKEGEAQSAKTPGLLGPLVEAEIPEVIRTARLHDRPRTWYKYKDNAFYEDGILLADPAFFDMFSFPLVQGEAHKALAGRGAILINEKTAGKYFGSEDPVGKSLLWNDWAELTVAGIIKDIPSQSHLQFDFIRTHEGLKRGFPGGYSWFNYIHETYVQLAPGADAAVAGKKIEGLFFDRSPEIVPYIESVYLQPLLDIHLNAQVSSSIAIVRDRLYVYVFSIIAVIILFIACINFMNLAVARSLRRIGEVGMRKVVGSRRRQLIGQFLGESLVLTGLSAMAAMMIIELALPIFNSLTDKQLVMSYTDPAVMAGLGLTVLITGLIAGSYPAIYLSGFQPIRILQGMRHSIGGVRIRKALVITQFTCAALLIVCTTVVYKQVDFMQQKRLGFDGSNMIYIPAKAAIGERYETVKQELLRQPAVMGVTAQGILPTQTLNTSVVDWEGKTSDRALTVEVTEVDYNFFDVFNVPIVAGRSFSSDFTSDAEVAFIINEAAAVLMGMDDPVRRRITVGGRDGNIVGVVQDAHFKSLHQPIRPQVFRVLSDYAATEVDLFGIIFIKLRSENPAGALAEIEQVWNRFNTNHPFEYHYLNDTYRKLYAEEQRLGVIFRSFTILAVGIACVGLFGLASYLITQRAREIGVRKVLGASTPRIVWLLTRQYTLWILVANLIAWPIAWYAMNQWLQGFAYQAEIGWFIFAVSAIISLALTLCTAGFQAVRTALSNPITALRHE